jgi:hypothetical protein
LRQTRTSQRDTLRCLSFYVSSNPRKGIVARWNVKAGLRTGLGTALIQTYQMMGKYSLLPDDLKEGAYKK